ncbi:cupredoxin domain-containing protein [Vogesella sp. LIG4]|uniref:cupredoxin domain-containing protein n=1 Tax=Vogesella sp. LIG4 TaxID=1192162 RepID=UPI00081FDEF9|nr:cupredoxin domain-containing protein [Vogesella sp. LIG4]SCK28650.1 Cupredoxin-like domain-containing protein [Vogesella sp. LIG4]
MRKIIAAVALSTLALSAFAADNIVKLSVDENGFNPKQLNVTAGQDFVIEVQNGSKKAIEFESKPLRVEKVIAAGKTVQLKVKALKAGSYKFVNEFNEDKVKGEIVAK